MTEKMKNPSSETITEKREALVFAREFNGDQSLEPTPEEAWKAAADFKDLVGDTLGQNLDYTDTLPDPVYGASRISLLMSSDKDKNNTYNISVVSIENNGVEITVQETVDGTARLGHRYHVDKEGFVRRYDYNSDSELNHEERFRDEMFSAAMKSIGVDDPIEDNTLSLANSVYLNESMGMLEGKLAGLGERIENDKLSKEFGMNDQIVDENEIENLRALLENSKAKNVMTGKRRGEQ